MTTASQSASFSTSRPNYRKKIIICCDGTWQSSVSAKLNVPSNVTRLARRFACQGSDDEGDYAQVVYYDSGVGTGDIGFQTVIQGGTGAGLDTNVIEAYNFIVLNYQKGDKIYCFGFSRGAYTARCVAGLVTDIGIIQPRDMNEFPKLYELYQANNRGDEFRQTQHYHDWVQGIPRDPTDPTLPKGIFEQKDLPEAAKVSKKWVMRPHGLIDQDSRWVEVVGVFDTVGSLGIPDIQGINMSFLNDSYGFHNVKLSPFIKNAYHAMALDERRGPFSPTLWYIPYGRYDDQQDAEAEFTEAQSVKKYDEAVQAEKNAIAKLIAQKEKPNALSHESQQLVANKLEPFNAFLMTRDIVTLKTAEKQYLYQVWFPGVHINVGGGSNDLLKTKKSDLEQLANITFCWMAEMLRPHLSFDTASQQMFSEERQDAIERARDEKDYGTGATYYLRSFLEYVHLKDAPKYHISEETEKGWATGEIVDSFGGIMTIAGAVNRTPGQCIDTVRDKEGVKKPLVKLGHTREFIHPSVSWRREVLKTKELAAARGQPVYDPPALKGFENVLVDDKTNKPFDKNDPKMRPVWKWIKTEGGLKWVAPNKNTGEKEHWVPGPVVIPEWWIYPTKGTTDETYKSFERLCMPLPKVDGVEDPKEPKGWLHLTRDAIYKDSKDWQDALKSILET